MQQNLSGMYYYCERCARPVRKPEPFNPKFIPLVEIDGKLYCPDCIEYDEEKGEYKPKKQEQ